MAICDFIASGSQNLKAQRQRIECATRNNDFIDMNHHPVHQVAQRYLTTQCVIARR
jgi:hypothetical protein